MGNKNRPWKEDKKLYKKDSNTSEHKKIKKLIKEEKYKQKYED